MKIGRMRGSWQMLLLILILAGSPECPGQIETGSNDYQYALIEAVKQKNLGNFSEAVKLYRLVIREKPDCDAAYYELGTIYLMSGQVALALESLEKAYQLDKDNSWYSLAYMNALGAGERYDTMEHLLKEKIKKDPEEVEWEYQLASLYYAQNKNKKAVQLLEKIEKERGFSEKVTLLKASVYESQEEYELALHELERVMIFFPEAVQFRIVAAELCMKSGKEEQAARYYLDILEVDTANIFALTNLTDYYRKKEDYRKSFEYLGRSFRSQMIDARRKMAILGYYLSEEKFILQFGEEIAGLITILQEVHPEEEEVKLIASDFYLRSREYELAYRNLKSYLDVKGGNYPVYLQAILLANASELNEELIEITGRALVLFPDSADIRFFRGIGFYGLEKFRELIENYDSVSFSAYSNMEYIAQSRMLTAEAYYRLEKFSVSDSLFESLIADEPGNYVVLNNYSYYLAERGEKLEKAESWSRKAIENNPDNSTFLDTYAWVLFKLQKFDKAEKFIMLALEKGGENDPEINEHAGDIQAALNSPEIAMSYYEKALILGGDRSRLESKIASTIGEGNE
jgi:tetratricopeptide (TPR) repeat protein